MLRGWRDKSSGKQAARPLRGLFIIPSLPSVLYSVVMRRDALPAASAFYVRQKAYFTGHSEQNLFFHPKPLKSLGSDWEEGGLC